MPHERDESADSQAPGSPSAHSPDPLGRVAHADQVSGRTDTSRAPETDAAYHRLREAPAEGPPPKPHA